jgi:hypothetical protein
LKLAAQRESVRFLKAASVGGLFRKLELRCRLLAPTGPTGPGLMMSVDWGRPEAAGPQSKRRFWTLCGHQPNQSGRNLGPML